MTSFVVATAGHVDHGKSALVRALTGTEPDRWAQERQRGLTIDLGFAELTLASGRNVSLVDVPGHERFIGNMLAGLGPAPVVCLVVAADAGWQAQTSEHRDAIHALGLTRGIVVISRADLAPDRIEAVTAQIRRELAGTGLATAPIVVTSAADGTGLEHFRTTLDALLGALPPADDNAPIRYWVDRSFAVKGAGTVVTGTLAAGSLRVEDRLEVAGRDTAATIRQLQSHGAAVQTLTPVTRAAVNLRGVTTEQVGRGDALVTPGAWWLTNCIDVAANDAVDFTTVAQQLSVHLGTAAVTAHCRPLGPNFARLTLERSLPVHVGDRLILRGADRRLLGATIRDVDPPALRRRGAARRRAEALAQCATHLETEVARRGAMPQATVAAMGLPVPDPLPATVLPHDDWFVDRATLHRWGTQLRNAVTEHYAVDPAAGGIAQRAAAHLLLLPEAALLALVVSHAGLHTVDGRVTDPDLRPSLGAAEPAMAALEAHFAAHPFAAPTVEQLDDLGLEPKTLAAAAQQQRLIRLAEGIVVGPRAPALAMRELAQLDQPFTAAQARQALATTRRTLIPLLEYLDARGWTHRVDGTLRRVTGT